MLSSREFERYGPIGKQSRVQGFVDDIKPLIATFDERTWCLPGEQDRTLIFAEQLRLYNKWTEHISGELNSMSSTQLFTIPHAVTNSPFPLLSSVINTTICTTKQPLDWHDVEIYVDLRVGEGADHYIPMVKLRSGNPHDVCHWYDFALEKLKETLVREDDETCFCRANYAIYWINGEEWFQIVTDSDFKMMLKRFMEDPSNNAAIDLLIEDSRDGHDRPKLYPKKKKGCLKWKALPV